MYHILFHPYSCLMDTEGPYPMINLSGHNNSLPSSIELNNISSHSRTCLYGACKIFFTCLSRRGVFFIVLHLKICISSVCLIQLYKICRDFYTHFGNFFVAVRYTELNNRIISHVTDRNVFFILTVYACVSSCVSLCSITLPVEVRFFRELWDIQDTRTVLQ
jgi:hypothetical protein